MVNFLSKKSAHAQPLDDKHFQAQDALEKVLWSMIAAASVVLSGIFLLPEFTRRWLSIVGAVFALCIALLMLNRRRYTRLAGIIFIGGMWTILMVAAVTGGGIATYAAVYGLILILVAGLLFGSRAGIATALLCTLANLVLVIIETTGHMPWGPVPLTPMTRWVAVTALIIIVMALQHLGARALSDALRRTRKELEERNQAEEALRRSEELFRAIVEDQSEMIVRWKPDGTRTFVNQAYSRVFGGKPEEFIGSSFYPLVEEKYRESIRKKVESLTPENPLATEIHESTGRDGEVRWQEWTDRGLFDADGGLVELQSTGRDITERKRAEEELRRISERLQLATRAASIGIWDWDVVRDELVWDDAMYRLYGIRKEDFSGAYDAWAKSLAPEDLVQANAALQATLRGEQEFAGEFRIVWPDGSVHFIKAASQTFRDEEGRPLRMVGVNYDITERKLVEEQIALLHTLTMDVAAARDLPSALEVVLRRVCEKTGWALGQAWLPRQEGKGLDCCPAWFAVSAGFDEFRAFSRDTILSPGIGLPGRVWASHQPAWIRDVTQDTNFPRAEAARKSGLKAALGVPIVSGDGVIAVLEFFLSEPREEDERLVKLITAVAAQIGLVFERKLAEESLRREQELSETTLNSVPGVFYLFNSQGRYLRWNENLERVTGYTHEEITQKHPLDFFSQNDWQVIEERIGEVVVAGEATAEANLISKDGHATPYFFTGRRIVINEEPCVVGMGIDITERKRAEEALKESQRKLALAQRIAHVGHWERDLDTDLIIWSDEIYRIFGLQQRENDSPLTEWRHMLHPEDRERVSLAIDEAQRGGRRYDVEYRIMRPDGEVRYVHSHGDVIRDEQGRPRRAFGVAQDITARKRAEEALKESRRKLKEAQRLAHIGYWETDLRADSIPITLSEETRRLLGETRRLLRQAEFREMVHPDDQQLEKTRFDEMLQTGRPYDAEYRIIGSDGEIRFVHVWDEISYDEDGRPTRMFGTVQDITERKRTEEALRESERRFSDTLKNIEMIAVMADMKGDITFCNDYLLRLTGYKREEAIGRNWYEMFLPEGERAKVSEILNGVEPTGEVVVHMENEIKTRSGERRLVKWTNTTLRGLNGQVIGVAALGDDITERKAAEEQLRSSTAQLRALSARLQSVREEEGTRIAREIHDELGSALTGLKWDLERIDRALPDAENGGKIHSVHQKILTMTGLVDTTINTVRRISSELRPGVLDNLGLVPAIEWHAQQFQERTGIICSVDSLIEHVDLNREQTTAVFRIFQEAMTNVLRHAQATKVTIIIEEDEGEFIVEIKDNGRGITETERLGIHSLGLVGMRERANSVGGKLEINGIAGKGTAVIVRLSMKGGHDILRSNPAFEKNASPASSNSTERSRD